MRIETVLMETRVTDSVYIHDSIYIHAVTDTVYRERWRTCWRERTVHDTVREHTTDTVRETRMVERVVEVPKSGGNTGWLVAAILALVIIGFISFKVYRLVK